MSLNFKIMQITNLHFCSKCKIEREFVDYNYDLIGNEISVCTTCGHGLVEPLSIPEKIEKERLVKIRDELDRLSSKMKQAVIIEQVEHLCRHQNGEKRHKPNFYD